MKKEDIITLMKDVAGKYGLKLVPDQRTAPKPELPVSKKNYGEMDSRRLGVELKELDTELRKRGVRGERVKEAIIKFMNDQQPTQYTKSVFDGARFDERRLQLVDKDTTKLANLRNHVDDLMRMAVENEMTERFTSLNPDLKGVVKNITVSQTPIGISMIVDLAETLSDTPKTDINPLVEPENPIAGITTSKSLGKGR